METKGKEQQATTTTRSPPPRGAVSAVDPQSNDRQQPLIRWDQFLPRRSLRILLVEHDDSTRHIVAALLRKCNYHVAGVADGMKAWEVMTEKKYCFDLVLTEVETPSVSGIGLLTRIVGTEECKNIPVVMMSTRDSVNVVLKCMLKGAVDFLVKPVRKNELRNLWQHVWRRHCSSSYASASDASNQISACAGLQSKTGENEEEADSQSSGSKPDIDIRSAQQQTGTVDENRKHTIEGGAGIDPPNDIGNLDSVPQIDNDNRVGLEAALTLPAEGILLPEKSLEKHPNYISPSKEQEMNIVGSSKGDNNSPKSHCQKNAPDRSVCKKVTFVEPMSDVQYSETGVRKNAVLEDRICYTAKSYHVVEDRSNVSASTLLELSLRKPQTNGCVDREFKENQVLKQSNISAFSRYGDKVIQLSWDKSSSSALCGRTKECENKYDLNVSSSDVDNQNDKSCTPERRIIPSPKAPEDGTTVQLQVPPSNKDNARLLTFPLRDACPDHASTKEDIAPQHPHYGFMPFPIPVGPVPYHNLCGGFGAIMQPMFYPDPSLIPQIHPYQAGHFNSHLMKSPLSLELPPSGETTRPQHWVQEPGEPRELSGNPTEQAFKSGSCGHDVLKGSGSNGSGETPDGAGATGTALESGNESGVQNCDRRGLDCELSRREAALLKFRLKRKERCFEKKVRYHNRKKLAEQRPRIKGQFVRQKNPGSLATSEADS